MEGAESTFPFLWHRRKCYQVIISVLNMPRCGYYSPAHTATLRDRSQKDSEGFKRSRCGLKSTWWADTRQRRYVSYVYKVKAGPPFPGRMLSSTSIAT